MSDVDLSTLRNARLLNFVLALAASRAGPGFTHQALSGFDALEFQIAARVAVQSGVAEGAAHALKLTPAGIRWAAMQLDGTAAILTADARLDLGEVAA
jgi:hypothetical protein